MNRFKKVLRDSRNLLETDLFLKGCRPTWREQSPVTSQPIELLWEIARVREGGTCIWGGSTEAGSGNLRNGGRGAHLRAHDLPLSIIRIAISE